MKKDNDNDLFDKENIPQSPWFSFVKVGDKVSGEVVEIFEKPVTGEFPAQICLGLKQEDGSVLNVGLKKFKKDGISPSYLAARMKNVALGDMVGFEFKKEIPPTVKGYHAAKSIEIFLKKADAREEGSEE